MKRVVGWSRKQSSLAWWLGLVAQLFFIVTDCAVKTPVSSTPRNVSRSISTLGVRLQREDDQVVMDNGLVRVTLSSPEGMVRGIKYKDVDNLLDASNEEDDRGYWDVNWSKPGEKGGQGRYERLKGTSFRVVVADEDQLELSFTSSWKSSLSSEIPLNVDKRFVLLRGVSGFYTYAIYERLEGWPDMNIQQTRIVFKPQQDRFRYMAISDDRQRVMPVDKDRKTGERLAYPEAVLLTDPANPALKGEVDDKYQYSCENKDNRVHGWISFDPPVGFWMITPSDEFRTGGPVKQDLTSHVGPTTLSMFVSAHYAGKDIEMEFRNGEAWKKVFGPVFVYLNSAPADEIPFTLWDDAKEQMLMEVDSWPYGFPLSEDFPCSDERGNVTGQLLVHDRYMSDGNMSGGSAYVGLAAPGEVGSWQKEAKGYQFWAKADSDGYFEIKDVRAGNYSVYAWVPGFIGDYRSDYNVTITPGSEIELGVLVYEPPRHGPTLWEIGVPERTAAEFYIPDANPTLQNLLYNNQSDKFRQYGLWARYTDLYPDQDLIYTVGSSSYQTDWFFAQVTRDMGNNKYQATTWQIRFELENVSESGTYKLQLALASATESELQVRFNDANVERPHFTTGLIGKDNAIARHGIHGLYWLYSVDVPGLQLLKGTNTIFLTQSRHLTAFQGIMYDYIRLEGPPEMN